MDQIQLNSLVRTRITLRHFDAEGRLLGEQVGKNNFTYAAADILVAALLRSGPSQITHLYARYGDQSGDYAGTIAAPGNDLKAVARAHFVYNSGSPDKRGGLWVPLSLPPSLGTTDGTKYVGNEVTLSFRIPGTLTSASYDGAEFNAGGATSYIGAIGLAVAPNFDNDRTQDKIFSVATHLNFSPAALFTVPKLGQTEVGYVFSLTSA